MDIVEQTLNKQHNIYSEAREEYRKVIQEQRDEIEQLRKVVTLLIEYEEHDENIYKGAVMWEALIEAAHRALMEKE